MPSFLLDCRQSARCFGLNTKDEPVVITESLIDNHPSLGAVIQTKNLQALKISKIPTYKIESSFNLDIEKRCC